MIIANLAKIFLILSFLGLVYMVLTKIKILVTMPDIYCKGCNRIKKTFVNIKDSVSNSESLKNITSEKVVHNLLSRFRSLILKIEKKISSKLHDLSKKDEGGNKEDRDYWKKLKKTTKKK
jgi:hypothetical protein